jgi:hypothetical protein
MGSYVPFEYLKHKLWPKKGLGVKLSIWLPTTKILESPWIHCVQVACHMSLERSWRGIQLFFRPHFNRRFVHKVMGFKVAGALILGILGLPLGSPWTRWHLGVGPMARHKKYYKGEGGGFPQVQVVVSLVSPCLPMACSCAKSAPTLHYPTCCLVCASPCE